MLPSVVDRLLCPMCRAQGHPLVVHVFTPGAQGHVMNGMLACRGCGTTYPIEDGLLELVVPALLEPDDRVRFDARFAGELAALRDANDPRPTFPGASDYEAQRRQRALFDWYAENDQLAYHRFHDTPFWHAVDARIFARWQQMVKAGTWLLDVGCADGRSTFPLTRDTASVTVIGFDISKKLVRQAMAKAEALGMAERTTLFVADASHLPLRDNSVDYVLAYGVLHHLPDPARTCRDVLRVLKPGGIYFGSENNQSVFRSWFDWLMKIAPLWKEEAGAEPLISRAMLDDWIAGLPAAARSWTSVFLPPHIFNLLGEDGARSLLTITDRTCRLIPGLRNHGGLIGFELEKLVSA
jgi:SAM-dependent methyltransferase